MSRDHLRTWGQSRSSCQLQLTNGASGKGESSGSRPLTGPTPRPGRSAGRRGGIRDPGPALRVSPGRHRLLGRQCSTFRRSRCGPAGRARGSLAAAGGAGSQPSSSTGRCRHWPLPALAGLRGCKWRSVRVSCCVGPLCRPSLDPYTLPSAPARRRQERQVNLARRFAPGGLCCLKHQYLGRGECTGVALRAPDARLRPGWARCRAGPARDAVEVAEYGDRSCRTQPGRLSGAVAS